MDFKNKHLLENAITELFENMRRSVKQFGMERTNELFHASMAEIMFLYGPDNRRDIVGVDTSNPKEMIMPIIHLATYGLQQVMQRLEEEGVEQDGQDDTTDSTGQGD